MPSVEVGPEPPSPSTTTAPTVNAHTSATELNELKRTTSPEQLPSTVARKRSTGPGRQASLGFAERGGVEKETRRRSGRHSTGDSVPWPPRRTLTLTGEGGLFTPERKITHTPTYFESMKAIVCSSWLNLLLVFIVIGWVSHFVHLSDTLTFVFTFLAIIPLAKLLGYATEELAMRVGEAIGGLLNATLGNAVELIVAIIALTKCELQVVQSSLIGSILSNLLLVLGMCFFAGGIRFSELSFGSTAAQLNSSLLALAVIGLLIPQGFRLSGQQLTDETVDLDILKMSRGIAVILFIIYALYIVFQLWSHTHLYKDDPALKNTHTLTGKAVKPEQDEESEEGETPTLNLVSTIVLLVVVTVLVAVTAEFLVGSINGLVESTPLSQQWVGLILLPIVGNAAEHLTAVTAAYKDKMDLAMGVAVGSSIQIALFVIPLLVIIAWGLDKPLPLLFDPFESLFLFLAVWAVNYTIQDGRTNWLEGVTLMFFYVIIAVSIWWSRPVEHLMGCS